MMLKIKIMRRRKWKLKANLRIIACAKCYLARKAIFEQKRRLRRLADGSERQRTMTIRMCRRYAKTAWTKVYQKCQFFNRVHMFLIKKLVRRRFRNWKFGVRDRSKLVHAMSLKIQKSVRMWIIKRYVLNYYRWRRGLVALQSNMRRQKVLPWFRYNIKMYVI